MKTIYSGKKAQIVLEVLREDKTLTEVANEYEIHQAQLSKWKQEFLENMPMIFKKKEKEEWNCETFLGVSE